MLEIAVAEILRRHGKWIIYPDFIKLVAEKRGVKDRQAYNLIKRACDKKEIIKMVYPNRTTIYGLVEFGPLQAPSKAQNAGSFPIIDFELVPRQLPQVGTYMLNRNDYPIKVRVEARTLLDGKEVGLIKDRKGYYSGEREWRLDPHRGMANGSFTLQEECWRSIENGHNEELNIEFRITATDRDEKERKLSPRSWTYVKNTNVWFFEPTAFTKDSE